MVMPKLPKELQKRKKEKIARIKGTSSTKQGAGGSRAMRRRLKAQGIDQVEQIEDAQKVIIQLTDSRIIINNPQIMKLEQGGATIFQIIGEPSEQEQDLNDEDFTEGTQSEIDIEESTPEKMNTDEILTGSSIKDTDVILVASQANVSNDVAKKALEEASGDLARAILNLKTI